MTIRFHKQKEKIMALVQVRPAVISALAAAVLACIALPASAAHASAGGGSYLVGCSSWSADTLITDANGNLAFVQYEVCDYINNPNTVYFYHTAEMIVHAVDPSLSPVLPKVDVSLLSPNPAMVIGHNQCQNLTIHAAPGGGYAKCWAGAPDGAAVGDDHGILTGLNGTFPPTDFIVPQ